MYLQKVKCFQGSVIYDGTLIENIKTKVNLSLVMKKVFEMILYRLKLVVSEKKFDEFIDSLSFISYGIREEEGCLDFSLYKDLEMKNAYRVLAEWKTRQAMEAHFNQKEFSLLLGAARVLGEKFEMSIEENLEKGRYPFAQKKITMHPGKGNKLETQS